MKNFKLINTVMSIIYLAAFIILAYFVCTEKVGGLNHAVYSLIISIKSPALTFVMKALSCIGEWYVYIPLALLLLISPKTRINYGLPVSVTLAASALLNYLLKLCFSIDRPDVEKLAYASGYGFPSGHVMNGAVFAGMLIYLFILHNKKYKVISAVCGVIYILAMGFSRIYLGAHNATDVVGAILMAAGVITFSFSLRKETFTEGAETKRNII